MFRSRFLLVGLLLVLVFSMWTPGSAPVASAAEPTPVMNGSASVASTLGAETGVEVGLSAVPTWCQGMDWAGGIYMWRMRQLWYACYGYAPYGLGR